MLAQQHRHQQPWVQTCQQRATMRYDGIYLCGTHINKLPDLVVTKPVFGFGSVEEIPDAPSQ